MSEPHVSTTISTFRRSVLRAVVLGMPKAGKSALIDALSQTPQSQDARPFNDGLLEQSLPASSESDEEALAAALSSADALVLAADVAAGPLQVDAELKDYERFLRRLELERGRNNCVGGFPVFLILTKGDLLADTKDSFTTWLERIDERRRQVQTRFRDFMPSPKEADALRFGRLSLQIAVTALKQPAFPDPSPGPYGVAELALQLAACGRDYRFRRTLSNKRLVWTLLGSLGLVAALAGLALFLLIHRTQEDPRVRELLTKVESYRMREPMTPSQRLRGQLQLRISELTDLQNDPDYSRLPQTNREFVTTRLHELDTYRGFHDALAALPAPGDLQGEKELENLELKLRNLSIPTEHHSDWSQTEAVLLRTLRLEQLKTLRGAVTAEQEKYRGLIRRGEELWTSPEKKEGTSVAWPAWNKRLQGLLEEADLAEHRPAEHLPGSELTYETVFAFGNVATAREEWRRVATRLQRISDVSAALGLAGAQAGRAPLDIAAGFTIDDASARAQNLRKAYPRFQEEFTLIDLPESIVSDIRQAAQARYENLLKAGRDTVLGHLNTVMARGAESFDSWRLVQPWAENPPELQAWRVLATVLKRLQTSDAPDPVNDLAAFLKRDQFNLTVDRLELEIPDDEKVKPAGKLVIHLQKAMGAGPADFSFEPLDDGRHDAAKGITRFGFRPTGATGLTYRPGDTLWADLPVKADDQADWMLTWAAGRSRVYQFERLAQSPRLHRKEQPNLEGKMAERVTLRITPESGLPKVPDLIPLIPAK